MLLNLNKSSQVKGRNVVMFANYSKSSREEEGLQCKKTTRDLGAPSTGKVAYSLNFSSVPFFFGFKSHVSATT